MGSTYMIGDIDTSDVLGIDQGPTVPPVVPSAELSTLDLPGQFDSIPGGTSTNGAFPGGAADPSGINSLFLDHTANPTPTGGYMTTLAAIAGAAAGGFSTYAKGSPSVATPRPMLPGTNVTTAAQMGKTNWLFIGAFVVIGIGVIAWLAKAA